MRIALFVHSLHEKAGTERMVATLANALSPRQELFIIEKCYEGASAFGLHPSITRISLTTIGHNTRTFFGQLSVIENLRKMLRHLKIEVLIISESYKTFCPIVACKLAGTKSVVWEHFNCSVLENDKGNKSIGRLISLKCSAALADKIVVLTKEDQKLWKKKYGVQHKLICIPNMISIPSDAGEYHSKNKTVLAVGRVVPQKGFDLLIAIWKKLMAVRENTQWRLTIVGNQDDNRIFSDYVKQLASDCHNIVFLPPTDGVGELYKKASIFVFPSLYEGFGLALAEAQMYGLPAVAFNCTAGPSDIVDDKRSGFLVPPGDIEEFANRLQSLMSDRNLRSQFSSCAKLISKRFSTSNVVQEWEDLLRALVSGRRNMFHSKS